MRNLNHIEEKNKIARPVAQTAMLMAILTLVSKLFGFVREMVMAGAYGTSYVTDAYVMAIAIPSMLFLGFDQAISTAYMPLFSDIVENEDIQESNKFTSGTIELSLIIAVLACLVGVIFAEPITSVCASGFTGEKLALTVRFVRVTFCYGLFTSVAGILEALLRYRGVFLAPLTIGYVQNIILICIIFISACTNSYFLIYGWLFAYIVRLILVWFMARRHKFQYCFTGHIGSTAKKLLALSIPVFIGSYVNQINVFVDKALASSLPDGSVAALNYGNLLVGLFSGLTVSVIMIIIYPKMVRAQALHQIEHFNAIVSSAINLLYIIAFPCTLGIIIYDQEIVRVIYERGAFSAASTALTGTAVLFYSLGILFIAMNTFFTQIFYSKHDMKTPVLYGLIGTAVNIIGNLVFVRLLAHGGLALSTSLAAVCNAMLLYYGIRKYHAEVKIEQSVKKIGAILGGAVLAVGCSRGFFQLVDQFIQMPQVLLLGAAVLMAGGIYLLLLKLLKVEELAFLKQLIQRN